MKIYTFNPLSEFRELMAALVQFRDARDLAQFHDTKNLAVALSIEVAELNELFLWKDAAASEGVDQEKIKEELEDVLLLVEKHNLGVKQLVLDKIAKNNEKYPVEKSKGSAIVKNLLKDFIYSFFQE